MIPTTVGGMAMERPVCRTDGCENVAEQYRNGRKQVRFRPFCSSCRKRKDGRPIGTWQRERLVHQATRAQERERLQEVWERLSKSGSSQEP